MGKPSNQVIKVHFHNKKDETIATTVLAVDMNDPLYESVIEAGTLVWRKRHFNWSYKVHGENAYVFKEVSIVELPEDKVDEA